MACPHCGDHLIHKRDGALRCCGCGRPRHDLGDVPLLGLLRRHAIVLMTAVLCLPLGLAMAVMQGQRTTAAKPAAELHQGSPDQTALVQIEPMADRGH